MEEQIFLNQFTQELHSLEEMNAWFSAYDLQNKRDILHNLLRMVIQAHPTYEEIESSAIELKKARSPSAVKLLNPNKPFPKFGHEICDLPEKELQNGFDILLLTLAKADNRRKNQEDPGQCHHWWHKDLSDKEYLYKLEKDGFKNAIPHHYDGELFIQ